MEEVFALRRWLMCEVKHGYDELFSREHVDLGRSYLKGSHAVAKLVVLDEGGEELIYKLDVRKDILELGLLEQDVDVNHDKLVCCDS